ncbi:MAG: RNA polymerase sigma factor [Chloroflexi bacterium]|nr:MAG: RNA polymerase sigma factor [Chloroflexota bacterium]
MKTDDRSWFEPLVRSLGRPAWKYAFVLVHDVDTAQDLVQEAFARVWASVNTPAAEVEFRRYLYRTITNLAHNYRRQQIRAAMLPFTDPTAVDPLDEVDRRAGDRAVQTALRGLRLPERQAIYLRYYEDQSFAETARIMGMPQVSVRVIVHRALGKLRRQLQANATGNKVAIS